MAPFIAPHLLSLLFYSSLLLPVEGDATLIDYACSKTTNPKFCATVFTLDRRSATADMRGLAKIALLHGQAVASEAEVAVTKMLQNATRNGGETRWIVGLTGCKYAYVSAAKSFVDAIEKLAAEAYSDASFSAGGATAEPPQCEFAISKGSDIPFPPELAEMGEAVVNLATLSVDVIDLLTL